MAEFGLNFETIGSSFGILIVLFIIIKLSRLRSEHNAKYGTGLERKVKKKTGLGRLGKKLKRNLKSIIGQKQKTKDEESKEIVEEATAKKRGTDKPEIDVEEGAIKVAKAAEEFEESAEALDAIEGRALGLIAGLKLVEQAIENYVQRESQEESKEQNEIQYISHLYSLFGHAHLTSFVLNFLKIFQ